LLFRLNPDNINSQTVDQIVKLLQNGGVIIYPTDTVYALGADITKQNAFERICRLKGIKPDKSNFSFVCSDLSHLSQYAKPISNSIFRVMKKALPGPYTFILEANSNVPKLLRVPDNAICKAIIEQLGNPLISTSLHDNSDDILEYFSDPEVIYQQYQKQVDAVVDGGFGNIYTSTVIDCSNDEPIVIREGLGDLNVLN
jgi:tRNA threonylcarbamoyl adenosine modification protein (Sua5/YciO/YrdC/YwlC family)